MSSHKKAYVKRKMQKFGGIENEQEVGWIDPKFLSWFVGVVFFMVD